MALDGAFLHCLRQELADTLMDAKIEKVHQPSKEELVLLLRNRNGHKKLYFSIRASGARVCLTNASPENPASPPMWCMLLRKKLIGGRLTAIRQIGLERVLYFDFDCFNELGEAVKLTLAAETMGRYSNVILLEHTPQGAKIVDAMRRVDFSAVRPVLPGMMYEMPPSSVDRVDFSSISPEKLADIISLEQGISLADALSSRIQGLSPLLCRELAHRAVHGRECYAHEMTADERTRLCYHTERLQRAAFFGEGRVPYLLRKPDGTPLEFSFLPIIQYGLSAVGAEMPSFSELLEAFYAERDQAQRHRQQAQELLRVLTTASERLNRKQQNQQKELKECADRETKRLYGDLINAHMHEIPRGASSADLVNYYDPDCRVLTVPLDPALSAAKNAARYYKEYRKAQRAEQILQEQLSNGTAELKYLDSVFDALSRAETAREIAELRAELEAAGYVRSRSSRQKLPPAPGPLRFVTDDGLTVLVGRNNIQNDRLTFQTAQNGDYWFHVKGIPGSHTILQTQGDEPPESSLVQAAILAAFHSKASASSQVPVDYTAVRFVKKPSGARPGMVIYEHQHTVYVTPDAALAKRLAYQEGRA